MIRYTLVGITKALAQIGASIRILDMNIDTTTATGTLMLNIFASVAQFERDQMFVRQRVGIEATKLAWPPLPLGSTRHTTGDLGR